MANQHQHPSQSTSRRYTISQLLKLARGGPVPFDLSKFTYDAARAGVVPPLGDCAMSLRGTSGNRPRGWSTETVSTAEDPTTIHGNAVQVSQPERQPQLPPVEDKNQKDEGFVRFLEKHSSPTHNRVTARGRIVPMEKRESPPKFDLPQLRHTQTALAEPTKHDPVNPPISNGTTPVPATGAQPSPIMPGSIALTYQDSQYPSFCDAHNEESAPHEQFEALSGQMNHMELGHYQRCMPMGPSLVAPNTFLNPMAAVSYSAYPLSAPNPWTYTYDNQAIPYSVALPGMDLQSYQPYAQQKLKDSENLYQQVQEQLRAIDACRARTQYDPILASQRTGIAEMRDTARKHCQWWKQTVTNLAARQKDMATTSPTNVQAPPYVPQVLVPKHSPAVNIPTGINTVSLTPGNNTSAPGSKRKPIPIVRPPENTQEPGVGSSKGRNLNTERHRGEHKSRTQVQVGRATQTADCSSMSPAVPPILQERPIRPALHQPEDEMAETLSPSLLQGEDDIPATEMEYDGGWESDRDETHRLSPTQARADEEMMLDAARLPAGIIVELTFLKGDDMEIVATGLVRSPGAGMTEWESNYWRRKPIFNRAMLENVKRVARIRHAENWDDEQLLGLKPLPVGTKEKAEMEVYGSIHMPEDPVEYDCLVEKWYGTPGLEDIARYYDRREHVQMEERKVPTLRKESVGPNRATTLDAPLADNVNSGPMDIKTLSSISVSHINAVAMPPAFDGAGDAGRRDARGRLASNIKGRGSRLVQRSTPTGSA